ncbi:hypothetical protein ACSAZL_01070 [Methanosarcina sp. T3]|uniref:hypothetical protein n=1 Tax=Methanosarcina sp. T3 TaxID=3439062 RepID=UPI003F863C74
MTGSNSVNSCKEVILTSTGKEYVVERLKNNSPRSETLLSLILVEEDEEVPL